LEYSRFSHTFVGELTMRTSIKVFIIAAAFFMPAQDSKGCFFSSGSRCKALLTFANIREKQSFYILKHFYPTMRTSVKNASRLSITPQSTPAGETGTLHSGKPADITVIVTGKRNNQFVYVICKATYELFVELSKGNIFSELRFQKKFEAASLLYPEDMKALIGKSIKMM